jgi:hypothetical protein
MIIIPGQSGTYRHLKGRVTRLLADSGQSPQCDSGALSTADSGKAALAMRNQILQLIGSPGDGVSAA